MRLIALVLLLAGCWQLVGGAWITLKAELAQLLIARAWAGQAEQRPWPWADTWPVASLRVPNVGKTLYVLQDSGGQGLAFGPVRLQPSSAADKESAAVVIAGHRDTHFDFLASLRVGDSIHLQQKHSAEQIYRVQDIAVVDSRLAPLMSAPGTLILVTCFPFDGLQAGGAQRYVIQALPQFIHNQP
jgi:sortase A